MQAGSPPPADPTRRAVVCAGAFVALAAGLGGCALFLETARPDLRLAPQDGVVELPLDAVPAHTAPRPYVVLEVEGLDDKLILFRTAAADLAALTTTCTHLGCDVRYDGPRDRMVCPCHGSEYDTHGANLKGPADEPLTAYRVTVEGDRVRVFVAG